MPWFRIISDLFFVVVFLLSTSAYALAPPKKIDLAWGTLRFMPSETENRWALEPREGSAGQTINLPTPDDAVLEDAWIWHDKYLVTHWRQGTRVEAIRIFDAKLQVLAAWVSEFDARVKKVGDHLEIHHIHFDQDKKAEVAKIDLWPAKAH